MINAGSDAMETEVYIKEALFLAIIYNGSLHADTIIIKLACKNTEYSFGFAIL